RRVRIAELELRQQLRGRRLPGDLAGVHELCEQQRREPLRVRGDHVERIAVAFRGAAELADADAAGVHDLAVLHEAERHARYASRLRAVRDELGERRDARGIQAVRLLARERLTRIALRQQLVEDQRDLRAALLADR